LETTSNDDLSLFTRILAGLCVSHKTGDY